jgi:hypothetical protein
MTILCYGGVMMKKQTILKCAISIFLFTAVQTAWAGFLFVDVVGGNDLNDGLSWETPFATIQKGIDEAVNGDTVTVADGVYTGTGNRDIDFNGKAITVQSENGPENCIIDCNGTESEPHRGFYFHSDEKKVEVYSALILGLIQLFKTVSLKIVGLWLVVGLPAMKVTRKLRIVL